MSLSPTHSSPFASNQWIVRARISQIPLCTSQFWYINACAKQYSCIPVLEYFSSPHFTTSITVIFIVFAFHDFHTLRFIIAFIFIPPFLGVIAVVLSILLDPELGILLIPLNLCILIVLLNLTVDTAFHCLGVLCPMCLYIFASGC